YLNRIRAEWQSCEQTVRTSRSTETETPPIFLRDAEGKITELRVPDISGESYNDFWEHRGWPENFDALVSAAEGIMLFVHPDNLREPELLDELGLVAGEENVDSEGQETPAEASEWGPEHAADQVKLVELLQFVRARSERTLP